MPNAVVHFEIIGKDPAKLRTYYRELFGWDADTNTEVAPTVSDAGSYGFINNATADTHENGIPGGIGGGGSFAPHTIFYVGVTDVTQALDKAEQLGGKRVMDPTERPGGGLVVAHFADPEGNLIGLAGPQ
jgi:uncharacterized protein